jgi:molybdopterin/thiamine biosynthesis adenylyltransferase
MSFSSRHSADLNGQLTSFTDVHQQAVRIRIDRTDAGLAAVQHTAAMLVNMLSRLHGVVKGISIDCPAQVPLCGRITPLASRRLPLDEALADEVREIGVVPLAEYPDLIIVNVGRQRYEGARLNIYGEGWWGGVFTQSVPASGESSLPFGPYVAAAIATAEVFKLCRLLPSKRVELRDAFFSTWSHRAMTAPDTNGPNEIEADLTGSLLAGVGAVGCSFLHTLWTMNLSGTLVIADNDIKGIDDSNLNRYCLFGVPSIGKQKASEAKKQLYDATFLIQASDTSFEELYEGRPNRFELVISAVDNNDARGAIQDKYPATILSASTSDLRAELLCCGPPGEGACLRCFNPPVQKPSDDVLRANLLKLPERIATIADDLHISMQEARDWVESGKCSVTGSQMLELLQREHSEPIQFAVPFTSVMAGVLLAAEFVKMLAGFDTSFGTISNRASVQFFNLLARERARTFLARDPDCPKCASGVGLEVWQSRSARSPLMIRG